ncbi:hypothetical protein [Thiomonas sp.]
MAGNDVKKLEKMKADLEAKITAAKAMEKRRARICRAMEGAGVFSLDDDVLEIEIQGIAKLHGLVKDRRESRDGKGGGDATETAL